VREQLTGAGGFQTNSPEELRQQPATYAGTKKGKELWRSGEGIDHLSNKMGFNLGNNTTIPSFKFSLGRITDQNRANQGAERKREERKKERS